MKKFALISLAVLLACTSVTLAEDPPAKVSGADQLKEINADIDYTVELFDQIFGGLSADEKTKLDELAKKFKAEAAADIKKVETEKARSEFVGKAYLSFQGALNKEHAANFDALAVKYVAKKLYSAYVSQIAFSLCRYADKNGDKLPADFGVLIANGACESKMFVKYDENKVSKLPENIQNASLEEQAKWVNANSDYIYTGAGRDITRLERTYVLIYDKDGTVFGCADGVNRFFSEKDAAIIFEELKAGKNPPPSLKDK